MSGGSVETRRPEGPETRESGGLQHERIGYKPTLMARSLPAGVSGQRTTASLEHSVDLKTDFVEDDVQTAPATVAARPRALRAIAKASIDLRAIRADATWQASSFDLAQGLEVKVMQSKLSPETLDRLFRG